MEVIFQTGSRPRPRPRRTPWRRGLFGHALRFPQLVSHGQREANGCPDAQTTSRTSKPSKVGWTLLRTRDARCIWGKSIFRPSWLLHMKTERMHGDGFQEALHLPSDLGKNRCGIWTAVGLIYIRHRVLFPPLLSSGGRSAQS